MPKIVKSFRSVNGNVVNPSGFRAVTPARARLKTVALDDDISVVFPFGPQEIKHDTLSGKTVEIARPGRKPLLFLENPQLRTVSFSAVIADKASGGTVPVTDTLEQLETIAANAYACTFTYGLTSLAYNVVLTQFSYSVTYRNNAGEPLRASVDIQLTETPIFSQTITELVAVLKTPVVSTGTFTKGGGGGETLDEDDEERAAATSNIGDAESESALRSDAEIREDYYAALSAREREQQRLAIAQQFDRDQRKFAAVYGTNVFF